MRYLLNTSLSRHSGEGTLDFDALQKHINVMGKLAEHLLLYDQVLLLTRNYENLTLLLRWMTIGTLESLLEQRAIGFIRTPGVLAYVPISLSKAKKMPEGIVPVIGTWRASGERHPDAFSDPEAATTLIASLKSWNHRKSESLARKVARVTRKFDLAEVARIAVPSTISDIEKGENYLPIASSDVRQLDELSLHKAQQLLRLASLNVNLVIASRVPTSDIHTDALAEHMLRAKLASYLAQQRSEAWQALLQLRRLPDVPSAVREGRLQFSDVVKIRNTRNAARFREWFHTQPENASPEEMKSLYVDALSAAVPTDRLGVRALRFLVTEGVALLLSHLHSLSGLVVSAADTFILDRFLSGWTPKVFLDDELGAYLSCSSRLEVS